MKKILLLLGVLISSIPSLAANQLTLYFIPSPKGINWSSPMAVARSTLKNEIARSPAGHRHSIGHVYEELQCGDYHRYLGMTDVGNNQEMHAIFSEKVGMGVILKKYVGEFNSTEEAIEDLTPMELKGRSNFITFKVSESTCNRMVSYIDEYQRRGYDQIYAGLNAHPLHGDGSGCSAFGASFLEISGLMPQEFTDSWMRHFIVPYSLIGGPITGKKVSFLKVLFARRTPWASRPDQGVAIDFWDPDLMHQWVTRAVKDLESHSSRSFPWSASVTQHQNSFGITFDSTSVPTPQGPFFKN